MPAGYFLKDFPMIGLLSSGQRGFGNPSRVLFITEGGPPRTECRWAVSLLDILLWRQPAVLEIAPSSTPVCHYGLYTDRFCRYVWRVPHGCSPPSQYRD